MATDPQTQLLHDRFMVIPHELRELLISTELPRKINLLSRKYNLTADQERILQNEITFVLLILDSTDNLAHEIEEGLGIIPETATSLAWDTENYILKSVTDLLAHTHDELVAPSSDEEGVLEDVESDHLSVPSLSKEGRNTSLQNSAVHPPSDLSKDSILREIEKPQKTVLKRYAIEYDHQPLRDTTHLIGDKMDDTLKLQDHYTD